MLRSMQRHNFSSSLQSFALQLQVRWEPSEQVRSLGNLGRWRREYYLNIRRSLQSRTIRHTISFLRGRSSCGHTYLPIDLCSSDLATSSISAIIPAGKMNVPTVKLKAARYQLRSPSFVTPKLSPTMYSGAGMDCQQFSLFSFFPTHQILDQVPPVPEFVPCRW